MRRLLTVLFAVSACAAPQTVDAPPADPVDEVPSPAAVETSTTPVKEPPKPPSLRLPETARPLRYAAELTLTPNQDTFTGAIQIELELRQPTKILWLNAKELV